MSNSHNYDLNVEEKVVKTYIVYELSYYTPLIVWVLLFYASRSIWVVLLYASHSLSGLIKYVLLYAPESHSTHSTESCYYTPLSSPVAIVAEIELVVVSEPVELRVEICGVIHLTV